jgi:hypothetical protein
MPRNGFYLKKMLKNGKILKIKKSKSITITRNLIIKKLMLWPKLKTNRKFISQMKKSSITRKCTKRLKSMMLYISNLEILKNRQ